MSVELKAQAQEVNHVEASAAAPINYKVEQVLRAMYFGYEGDPKSLQVGVTKGTALCAYDALDYCVVGVADERGYRFTPASNSALITLGYHPTAVLLLLSQMRYNGEPVLAEVNGDLVALHAAAAQCARDVVFNYEKLEMVKGKPRVVSKPVLDNYRAYTKIFGKPKFFA